MSQSEADGLQPQSARYRELLEVSRRLTSTLGEDELYAAIYRETSAVLAAPAFFLALYDQSRDLARVVFYADEGDTSRAEVAFRGSDSRVFKEQAPVLVDDGLSDRALIILGKDTEKPARSAVAAPIMLEGQMLGAISAQSYEPGAYASEDLELLDEIAGVAAVALRNSLQFEELEQRRAEAEQLEEIGRALTSELDPGEVVDRVITAVQSVLNVDGTAVWRLDPNASAIGRVVESGGDIALPIGLEWDITGELYDRLVDQRVGVVLEDLEAYGLPPEVAEHMTGGSAIGVPVIVAGHVDGVLTAGSRAARHFTDDDIRVLQRLATQFAVALRNARLHEDLHAASLTDPLTGLPNRRRLQIHLDHEVAAARRGRPLGIAVMDIDRFKHYNDSFGHVAGDDILRAIGAVLANENRAMNIVARYGGDEFVSILSDTQLEGARNFAKRVTSRIAEDPTLKHFGITVSVGVAEFDPETMATPNDLLRAADSDMYDAKAEAHRVLGS